MAVKKSHSLCFGFPVIRTARGTLMFPYMQLNIYKYDECRPDGKEGKEV